MNTIEVTRKLFRKEERKLKVEDYLKVKLDERKFKQNKKKQKPILVQSKLCFDLKSKSTVRISNNETDEDPLEPSNGGL